MDTSEKEKSHFYAAGDNCYIRLTPTAWKILSARESNKSYAEIAKQLSHDNEEPITSEHVEAVWEEIQNKIQEIKTNSSLLKKGFWIRFPLLPKSIVIKIARVFQPAFHPIVASILILFSIATAVYLYLHTHQVSSQIQSQDIIFGYLFYIFSIILHEFGHASACYRFGAQPSAIGFALYMVFPAFYSDVSDSWKLRRWQRLIIDLSGMYFHTVIGGIYVILWFYTGWESFGVAVVSILASMFINLNPILRFDGYWVLCDLLGVVNLGSQPIRMVKNLFLRLKGKNPPPTRWNFKTTVFLFFYSIAWFAFFIWLLSHIAPFVITYLEMYPQLLQDSISAIFNNERSFSQSQFVSLAISTLIIIVIFRLLWVVILRNIFKRFFSL